jgi:hypothetical protein
MLFVNNSKCKYIKDYKKLQLDINKLLPVSNLAERPIYQKEKFDKLINQN